MFTIRKLFKFESAHQLFSSYTDLCREQIHGHSYLLEVFLRHTSSVAGEEDVLNSDGMIVDFGHIKDIFKGVVDKVLDHSLFMPSQFPKEYLNMLNKYNKRLYIVDWNPTAENFAQFLFGIFESKLNEIKYKSKTLELATGDSREYQPWEVLKMTKEDYIIWLEKQKKLELELSTVILSKVRVHETTTGWAEYGK